ncbi:hypothetical protein [Desulfofundulus thermobenzoicus]|uniref:hypothetical protein n=1 Tax=Desulfofundulus thermobenzoicus TaxID=29376 RepID=UPI001A9B258A|nr:hypothetical protein [Desulfofundulus thermobenzoicus]
MWFASQDADRKHDFLSGEFFSKPIFSNSLSMVLKLTTGILLIQPPQFAASQQIGGIQQTLLVFSALPDTTQEVRGIVTVTMPHSVCFFIFPLRKRQWP